MKLKEYIDSVGLHIVMKTDIVKKLMELEALDNYFSTMLGVELEITVKPVKVKEGRWYGVGLAEEVRNITLK